MPDAGFKLMKTAPFNSYTLHIEGTTGYSYPALTGVSRATTA